MLAFNDTSVLTLNLTRTRHAPLPVSKLHRAVPLAQDPDNICGPRTDVRCRLARELSALCLNLPRYQSRASHMIPPKN